MESSQRLGTAIRAVLKAWQTVADHAGVKDMETLTAPFVVFDSDSFWYASLEEDYAEEAQEICLSDGVGIFTAVKTRHEVCVDHDFSELQETQLRKVTKEFSRAKR